MLKTVQEKTSTIPSYLMSWGTTFKGGLTIFCVLIMIIIPFLSQRADYLYSTIGGLFIYAMIFAIYAASWDFLAGFVGQVSFGHAIFFGIAGYVNCAFIKFLNYPWWILYRCSRLLQHLSSIWSSYRNSMLKIKRSIFSIRNNVIWSNIFKFI